MIYDCFLFFNEFELLKCRLEYLYDYVDYFVLTESNLTQSGSIKPLYYGENKHLFEKWNDKIIHNVVDFVPQNFQERTGNNVIDSLLNICASYTHYPHNVWRYENETFQRECIILPLIERCSDDDLILVSDLDEIPNRNVFKELKQEDGIHTNFHNSMRQYYINVLKQNEDWIGTFSCNWAYLKNLNNGLNGLRMAKRGRGKTIENAGWHLTFLGGSEKIKEKIRAYGHQEMNTEHILNNVDNRMASNQDIFFRPDATFCDVSLDDFDKDLLDIIKEYYPIALKG